MKKIIELVKKYPEVTVAIGCAIGIATIMTVVMLNGDKINPTDNETDTTEPDVTITHTVEPAKEAFAEETVEVVEETTVKTTSETTEETTSTIEPNGGRSYYNVPLSHELQDHIFTLCDQYGVSPSLVIAVIQKESNYDPETIGDNGNSFGLMQIQPRHHRPRMARLGCTNLLDPYQNITVGVDILAELHKTRNSVDWVLMAYNGWISYANSMYAQGEVSDYAYEVINNIKNLERVDE